MPACGAVIDSSIFIDSSTIRTSPAATVVAVGDVDEQDGPGHGRLERVGQRVRAGARGALRARLQLVAVAGDPDGVLADRHGVAARFGLPRPLQELGRGVQS